LEADNGRFATDYIAVKGIDFEGGDHAFQLTQGQTTYQAYFYECTFKYAYSDNGLGASAAAGLITSVRCATADNMQDGYNYHEDGTNGSGDVVEIDNVGRVCGTPGADNDNISSIHEDFRAVRVNCDYHSSNGPIIADVNTSKSWNLGVKYKASDAASGNSQANFTLQATAEAWVDSCDMISSDNRSTNGFVINASCTLNHRDTDTSSGTNIMNGTVSSY
jgi:hypothetical protein